MTASAPSRPRFLRVLKVLAIVATVTVVATCSVVAVFVPELFFAVRHWIEPPEYVLPVAGVHASALVSTWGAPRPGGRKHRGADIFAPKGTPALAASDGVVLRVGEDVLGGHVVWIVGQGHCVFYYAHLDAWAPGLHRGQPVSAGETIGYVGNTGNAITTPPHLHFGVHRLMIGGLLGVDPVPFLAKSRTIPRNPEAPGHGTGTATMASRSKKQSG
jgi:murein DD-endopeptidase MepM/ murein hydrolase activator NlpD